MKKVICCQPSNKVMADILVEENAELAKLDAQDQEQETKYKDDLTEYQDGEVYALNAK